MVIHCLAEASRPDRRRLIELLRLKSAKTMEQAAEVVELMRKYGSIEYAQNLAAGLIEEARCYLAPVPASPARDMLASMAGYFLDRQR
jgi:geranylgeranyl pyrophosphate synthase